MASANIARHLPLMAADAPGRPAIKVPRGSRRDPAGDIDYLTLSFAELDAEVNAWGARLAARGVRRGDRVLVMVRQGLPLIAAVFALFRHGAVPVVIDPGMGLRSFLACVARTRPRVLLGIPFAQLVSRVCWQPFTSIERRLWVAGAATSRLAGRAADPVPPPADTAADELAAILFTSGSTGAPKGVRYTHGMFAAQVRLVRETYGITPGEVDLPLLPIFALFNPALGMTTIVPELDPARPAAFDPARIVQALRQERVTNSFGSPTLWRRLAAHCQAQPRPVVFPDLRRVLMAGAPVPPALFAAVQALLPHGTAHSPYGATESLPVSSVSAPEVLGQPGGGAGTAAATAAGAGTCVGRPVAGVEVRIIAITPEPLASLAAARALPAGEIGEIIVRGPNVTREYDQLPAATAAAKIPDPAEAGVWHRLGDAGYRDDAGRLWFCGRVAERVLTADGPLYTEQVEPVFQAHPAVHRTALVGLGPAGRQQPALVVEPQDPAACAAPAARARLLQELAALAAGHPRAGTIRLAFFHPSFPVDVRHNAKIHRLTLARWAATQTGHPLNPPAA